MGKERASAAARAIITFFLLVYSAFCAAAPSVLEREAAIRGFGSRAEGSIGESETFDYVEASLRDMGLAPSIGRFSDVSEDYSKSRIVEALVSGDRDDELAIIVPVGAWIDSPDEAEGAFGIALALDEAARLSAARKEGRSLPLSIRFVFLGAEKRGTATAEAVSSLGSKTWISRNEGRGRLAVLYLNLPFPASTVALRSAGRGILSPYWYYEGTRRALEVSGIAYDIEANRQEAYRLGIAGDYGSAAPYLEAGIPAVELRGETRVGQGPGRDAASAWLPAFVDAFARGKADGFSESWDRHYFIVRLGKLVAVVREKTYVAVLVALVAMVALSILAASVTRRRAMKRLLKHVPIMIAELLALFGVLVAITFAGKGLSLLEAAAFGSANAWTLSPRIFVIARILFSLFLFLAILSYLVEKRILSPNPYFYEFSGLVCLAVDVLVFSVVDLSASFYFIWALLAVEASLAIHKRWATLLAYVLMYFPLLVVAGELLRKPDLASYDRLLSPDILGVFGLAALSLPFFVFTASPLLFFAHPGTAARRKAVVFLAALAMASEAGASAYFLLAVPHDGPGRGDLSLAESIDQDRGLFELRLGGAQRLGRGSLLRGETRLDYEEHGDRAMLTGVDRKKRIEIEETASPFLDRVDESIRVAFSSPPYSLELALESGEAMLLYDCSLPYKVAVDGRSATIFAGVNPGKDFSFSITVPESFRADLTVRARYLSPLEPCSQSSGSPLRFSGLTLSASRRIGAGIGARAGPTPEGQGE
jgi:hypothetical protein